MIDFLINEIYTAEKNNEKVSKIHLNAKDYQKLANECCLQGEQLKTFHTIPIILSEITVIVTTRNL